MGEEARSYPRGSVVEVSLGLVEALTTDPEKAKALAAEQFPRRLSDAQSPASQARTSCSTGTNRSHGHDAPFEGRVC